MRRVKWVGIVILLEHEALMSTSDTLSRSSHYGSSDLGGTKLG
jgi:hypothetical protein